MNVNDGLFFPFHLKKRALYNFMKIPNSLQVQLFSRYATDVLSSSSSYEMPVGPPPDTVLGLCLKLLLMPSVVLQNRSSLRFVDEEIDSQGS